MYNVQCPVQSWVGTWQPFESCAVYKVQSYVTRNTVEQKQHKLGIEQQHKDWTVDGR